MSLGDLNVGPRLLVGLVSCLVGERQQLENKEKLLLADSDWWKSWLTLAQWFWFHPTQMEEQCYPPLQDGTVTLILSLSIVSMSQGAAQKVYISGAFRPRPILKMESIV